ncbi:MAG TPA: acyl carrier protein, partial [Luteimonas sp.]|nr:acyl carrier protein [Luteimonas sp.]
MSLQTDAERELAELLVESLNLDGVAAADIDPEAPLFNA